MSGCKCAQCFGLAEFMLEATGRDHGLPSAQGHSRLYPVNELAELDMLERQRQVAFLAGRARRRVALPWEEDAA